MSLQVAQLFELSKKPADDRQDQLADVYRRLRAQFPEDSHIDWAYALALLEQRRTDEAVELLSNFADSRPTDFAARRLSICAILVQPKPGEVLGEMTSLAAQLVGPAAGQAADQDRLDAAAFLGQIVGYLEGPRPGIVEPDTLDAFAEKVRRQFSRPERIAFAVGRKKVADQFAALQADGEALRSAAKVKERAHRERDLKKVAHSTEDQAIARKVLDSQEKKLDDDAQRLEQVNLRLAALRERQKLLDDRAAGVQAARDIMIANYMAAERPGALAGTHFFELRVLTMDTDRSIAELNYANRQLLAEASVLEGRRQALLLEGEIQTPKLQRQEAGLTTEQKKTRALEAKASKARIAGNSAQAHALAVQTIRLQTYVDFSLEAEQQRLLDSLAAVTRRRN